MTDPTIHLPRQGHPIDRNRGFGPAAGAPASGVQPADWDDGSTVVTACTGIYGWPSDQCDLACGGAFGGVPGDLCTPLYETPAESAW
jgi:hypothetical protein